MKSASGKRIQEIETGEFARISGTVYACGEILRAPLSGRKCVYYHVRVTEGGRRNRRTIIEEEMMADVVLKYGRDYAVIDCDEPQTYLVTDREYRSHTFKDATPELEAFLARHEQESSGFFGKRNLQYEEAILEPGELFTVAGYATWLPVKSTKLKIPSNRVLFIRAGKEVDLFITDEPDAQVKP